MSDETKVPPGWVRLTKATGRAIFERATAIEGIDDHCEWPNTDDYTEVVYTGRSLVRLFSGDVREVRESPAEVAALIAAAQAAERRARALPVMAAILEVAERTKSWDENVERADAILDAIERREGE